MGAKAAMTVALRRRFPIANLISVDNAPVDAALKSDFGKYVQAMRKIADASVTKQSEADAILKEHEPSLPIRQFLLTNLARDKEDGIQKWRIPIRILGNALDHMADFPFRDPDEVRWEGPALFVRGTKSHYVSDETLPLIGRFFPRFEVVDVDCGHWVISEKPEEFRKGPQTSMYELCVKLNCFLQRSSISYKIKNNKQELYKVMSIHTSQRRSSPLAWSTIIMI